MTKEYALEVEGGYEVKTVTTYISGATQTKSRGFYPGDLASVGYAFPGVKLVTAEQLADIRNHGGYGKGGR